MKTQQQILDRIKELSADNHFFDFQKIDLVDYLDFDNAKEYLSHEATREEWGSKEMMPPKERIVDYLPFAWSKANGCRGLSSDRSIQHFLAWTWLIDDEFFQILNASYENDYKYYGKPQLVLVSEKYGFDWRAVDDNAWCNSESGPYLTAEKALAA